MLTETRIVNAIYIAFPTLIDIYIRRERDGKRLWFRLASIHFKQQILSMYFIVLGGGIICCYSYRTSAWYRYVQLIIIVVLNLLVTYDVFYRSGG